MPASFHPLTGIGQVVAPGGRDVLGTAFLVSADHALTALHCVAPLMPAPGGHPTGPPAIALRFPSPAAPDLELPAHVVRSDPHLDIAVLRLGHPAPPHLLPVPLGTAAKPHQHYRAVGFAAANWGVHRSVVTGTVTGHTRRAEDGAPVVALFCDQAAAGLALSGLSGGPVLVGRPERAVGVVRWQQPDGTHPHLATGGTFYATPTRDIATRMPELFPGTQRRRSPLPLRGPAFWVSLWLAIVVVVAVVVAPYVISMIRDPRPDRFSVSVGDDIGPGRPGAGAGEIEEDESEDIYTFRTREDGVTVRVRITDCSNSFDPALEIEGGDREYRPAGLYSDCGGFGDLGGQGAYEAAVTLGEAGSYRIVVTGPCKLVDLPLYDCTGTYRLTLTD
ncbi:serine protease [Streptomyces sp. NPDC093252]|uniref:trypsin-like serine peptidase n=1 Tax=Streptomyces sp. NPDC093252 TaxID=3154980 RepID=UPI0034173F94